MLDNGIQGHQQNGDQAHPLRTTSAKEGVCSEKARRAEVDFSVK